MCNLLLYFHIDILTTYREASIPAQLMSRLDQILAGVQGITASLRPQGMCY